MPYPPKMKEEIMRFVNGVVANATTKFRSGEKLPFVRDAATIAISGEGMSTRYQQFFGNHLLYDTINVQVTVYPNSSFTENGSLESDTLEINVSIRPPNYTFNMAHVEQTVEHELIHLVQRAIRQTVTMKDLEKEPTFWDQGTPAEWTADPKGKSHSAYLASGSEFFPWLQNMSSQFLQRPSRTKHDFLQFVKTEDFFKALAKRSPEMWKRSVKELWKMVNEKMDLAPDAVQKAKQKEKSRAALSKLYKILNQK